MILSANSGGTCDCAEGFEGDNCETEVDDVDDDDDDDDDDNDDDGSGAFSITTSLLVISFISFLL